MKDLGLSYAEALHGIQSAIRFGMSQAGVPDEGEDEVIRMLKHLKVGVDSRAADALGLAELLIAKGVSTGEEYLEHMRLAMNHELARYEQGHRERFGLPDGFNFR